MQQLPQAEQLAKAIADASNIVIIQADNPDADSLTSALALEQVLSDMSKEVFLYCGVDIPSYLRYIKGSDRVSSELPKQFGLSIIVDTSSDSLLEQLNKSGAKNWLAAKPCAIIDHHATKPTIGFASIIVSPSAVATAEVIYELAQQLKWPLSREAKELLAIGIMSDSLGLTSEAVSGRAVHIIGEIVESGVSMAELENARRESMRRDPELIPYKGQLLQRVEFLADGRVAAVTIPQDELDKYSPLYNPPMLVLDDMRLAKGVVLAVAFKVYRDGKITGKIRCNYGISIADKLAETFGGGGHPYAAGFKILNAGDVADVKAKFVRTAIELLDEQESQ
jgi:phosphoesterase RecJ-like protein